MGKRSTGSALLAIPVVLTVMYGYHRWGMSRGPGDYRIPVPPGAVREEHRYSKGKRHSSQHWEYRLPGDQVQAVTAFYFQHLPEEGWTLYSKPARYTDPRHGIVHAKRGLNTRLKVWVRPPQPSDPDTALWLDWDR